MTTEIKNLIKLINIKNIYYEEFDDNIKIEKHKFYKVELYLEWIIKRCLVEKFPIHDYYLVEIPYSNEECLIMDFWHKNKHGKCIDFVVYFRGFVVPQSCKNGNTEEHNLISEAVYYE